MSDQKPITIGWRELVALPDWGIRRVKAKIDTGARTSAIHVADLEDLSDGRVRFEVVTHETPRLKTVRVEAMPVRESVVRPSHGEAQRRVVCRTTMRLGGIDREIELSLVCRKGMLCRMLVGRRSLGDSFLIDPSRKYIVSPVKVRPSPSSEQGEQT